MSSKPQSKPLGDEDVIETFSLQERRRVEPDPVSQQDAMDRTIRRHVESVQQGVALPAPEPQGLFAGGSGDSTAEMDTLIAQMRSELSSVRAEVGKVRADANSRTTDTQRDTDAANEHTTPRNEETQSDTDRANEQTTPRNEQTQSDTDAANEHTTPRNEDTQRDTDRANEITQRDTDAADERTTPRNEDTQRDTDRANELVGKSKDEESEGEKDSKASGKENKTSSDGMPVSLDVRGKIYIPEVTPFEIWNEISNLSSGRSKLSLKCTVSNLQITADSFVDEFVTGDLKDMVEFDGSTPPKQISFTLPLAERIPGQGNTWFVCTQGGIYTTPIYCIDGNPAIFPTKHT